jgi:DUF4097 and DUF4098 domain-containing protein YvlB
MSFVSMNGNIDVTLPADIKSRLRLKTFDGSVYTDFDVKMEGAYGAINGGGPEYRFETMKGNILLHKK